MRNLIGNLTFISQKDSTLELFNFCVLEQSCFTRIFIPTTKFDLATPTALLLNYLLPTTTFYLTQTSLKLLLYDTSLCFILRVVATRISIELVIREMTSSVKGG